MGKADEHGPWISAWDYNVEDITETRLQEEHEWQGQRAWVLIFQTR